MTATDCALSLSLQCCLCCGLVKAALCGGYLPERRFPFLRLPSLSQRPFKHFHSSSLCCLVYRCPFPQSISHTPIMPPVFPLPILPMLLLISILLLLLSSGCAAEVSSADPLTLSLLFSPHMVLQRAPHRATVWGTAPPSTEVTAQIDHTTPVSTTSSSSGRWSLSLPPVAASTSRVLTVTSGPSNVTLTEVAFGDVFLCSGQSNMAVPVEFSWGGLEAVAEGHLFPNIRLFDVSTHASLTPLDEFYKISYSAGWVLPSNKTLWNGLVNATSGPFSAACWYTGRDVYEALNGTVPIGLIQSSYSGTVVEAWTSPRSNGECGPIPPLIPHENNTANQPSALYNSMIRPLENYTIAAVVWYQVENNRYAPLRYGCAFPAMIEDWRHLFHQPNLPFYFVLHAPDNDTAWAPNATQIIRQQQLEALRLPYVGVANTIDLGDLTSPIGAVHSRNKSYVGDRMSRVMRTLLYEERGVWFAGPRMEGVVVRGMGGGAGLEVVVRYPVMRENEGMFIALTPGCISCCDGKTSGLLSVEVLNATQPMVWYPTVQLDAEKGVLSANVSLGRERGRRGMAVAMTVRVTLEYAMYPQCALYNRGLLPSLPWVVDVAVQSKKGSGVVHHNTPVESS